MATGNARPAGSSPRPQFLALDLESLSAPACPGKSQTLGERSGRGRWVMREDGRVRPLRVGERGRCHVLGPPVQGSCDRVVVRIWDDSRVAGKDLVGGRPNRNASARWKTWFRNVAASSTNSGGAHPPRSKPSLPSSSDPPSCRS